MRPRIAIPEPHSAKPDYNARSLPQYTSAIAQAGGEAVVVPLSASPAEIAKIVTGCQGVLLPGSAADVDPQKYEQARAPETAASDPLRDKADELLLQDAYNLRKPVLGICYGLQILNVWRSGTLLQHIASTTNHEAGREVPRAHQVEVDSASVLGSIVASALFDPALPSIVPGEEDSQGHGPVEEAGKLVIATNSSHHQAPEKVGDGLRVVARCPDDGVIEAVEGTQPEHFVVGVQWHPERGVDADPVSRAIFQSFVAACACKR